MKQMILYLEKSSEETTRDDKTIFKGLNLHSFVCIYVLEYLKIIEESSKNCLTICFLNSDNQRSLNASASVDTELQEDGQFEFNVQISNCEISTDNLKSLNVTLPALHIPEDNYFIGGICAVLRHIISEWALRNEFKGILGHNGGNLSSPAEVSTWTRFVEIDLPSVVEGLTDVNTLPNHLARFEIHMKQPVKIHNIRKRIKGSDKKSEVNCTEDPILEYARNNHIYCEGPDLLLSDLIIYPMMYIIFEKYFKRSLADCIPMVYKWFKETMGVYGASVFNKITFNSSFLTKEVELLNPFSFPQDMDPNTSLYKCDPNRSNPKARVYTRQDDIQEVLKLLDTAKLRDKIIPSTGLNVIPPLDWSLIPVEVHPKGGGLPLSRLEKKCQQLESLYHAIRSLNPKEGDVIVDFCCGAGHLALLIAHLFPQCLIYCVEIKSKSLRRAQSRSNNLKNVTFFQCNMDYFKGTFDIGLSLHACGVATDLVISRCLSEKAKFVSCPCCYGSISDNHILKYPRSKDFYKAIKPQEYYILCHAADQTHPEGSQNSVEKSIQGRGAMNVVDSDRLLEALDCGYEVTLSQLVPPSCTPKNNILIGDFRH